jgi:hypothetical protein
VKKHWNGGGGRVEKKWKGGKESKGQRHRVAVVMGTNTYFFGNSAAVNINPKP